MHQMRYDDERSLAYKYAMALSRGLSVGIFTVNYLDYSASATAEQHRKIMWGLLPPSV